MRGKEFVNHNRSRQSGITPAYAGKSQFFHGGYLAFWDHPRVCGEKKAELTPDELLEGSPPRMRGKV